MKFDLVKRRTAKSGANVVIALGSALFFAVAACAQAPRPQQENAAPSAAARQGGPGSLKDAVELCDRLAGTEREICLQRARENRERMREGIGAIPGDSGVRKAESANDEKSGAPTPRAGTR